MPLYNPASSSSSATYPNYSATGVSNVYCTPPSSAVANSAMTALRFYMVPVFWRGGAATTIAFILTTAAAAGKVARYGIYNIKADGTPGTLVQEVTSGGAIAVDGSPATITGTISQTLAAGWYFLAFVSDGTPSVYATTNGVSVLGSSMSGTTGFTVHMLFRTLGALASFGDETGNTFSTNAAGTACPMLGLK